MLNKVRVYLDNCCFNRPFDDQDSLIIRLETDAKLHVQDLILNNRIELAWSFVLDYENAANPFDEVRERISEWKHIAVADCSMSHDIVAKAHEIMALGLRQKDASHIACALKLNAEYFITTDKKILNKTIPDICLLNPIDFVRRYSDAE